jgi:chromosomal replication initiator protein
LRAIVEDTALLAVPDAFTRDVIETQLRTQITDVLSRYLGRSIQVAVTIRPPDESVTADPLNAPTSAVAMVRVPKGATPAQRPSPDSPQQGGRQAEASHAAQHQRDDRGRPAGDGGNRLNPKYTFDSFVVGASNRFAHAAAVAVAESPAKAYNPLFIYGGSGLGKTHLLHAIGSYAQTLGTAKTVRYVSTEEFTNDFINSLRDDKQSAFQRRYRDELDILLVDDIQFLENRERTQEEFFHTFNTLHNANKQIVITSDRKAKDLATLEDRLRTRFEWGLVTDIGLPDLELRIAILQKKQAQERLHVPKGSLSSSPPGSRSPSVSSRGRCYGSPPSRALTGQRSTSASPRRYCGISFRTGAARS